MDVSKLTYEQISQQADDLALSGTTGDAVHLLRQGLEKARAAHHQGYRFFFEAEISYYQDKDNARALELHRKALEQDQENILFLRSVGVLLSSLGREEEAIKLFDEALKIKPDDYHSLRNKGVAVSKLGRQEEAIKLFDEALKIKPDDYDSLRNKGAAVSNLGREEEAIKLYDEALKIKPDDYDSLRNKGVALSKLGREEEAIKLFDEALKIKPDDPDTLAFKSLAQLQQEEFPGAFESVRVWQQHEKRPELQKYFKSLLAFLEKKIAGETEPEEDIFAKVCQIFQEDKGKFLTTISENRERLRKFTDWESSIPNSAPSFFSVLRKWNSYTPVLPSEKGDNRGGGYYLYLAGKDGSPGRGIVIDPGFNFVENFYEEGFKAADIDAVLISHAHNDHTVDFEAISNLVKEINDSPNGNGEKKRIDLLLNVGTFKKFSGWLDLKNSITVNEVHVLQASNSYDFSKRFNGLTVHTMRAKHDEVVDNRYCLGFVLEVDGCKIALTGDTGWEIDRSIAAQYQKCKPIDLMVVHLGSIGDKELEYLSAKTDEERQACLYPNHLGLLGVGAILQHVRPRLAIISEFGQELKPLRKGLAEKYTKLFCEHTRCLPGDVGLHVRLRDLAIFSIVHRDFVPFGDITVWPRDINLYYYKPAEPEDEREEIHSRAREIAKQERGVSLFERIKRGPVKNE